jgi:hypothetical protein
MISILKRWSWYPLFALVFAAAVAGLWSHGDQASGPGTVVGFILSVPAAYIIDRWRQHRRSAGAGRSG